MTIRTRNRINLTFFIASSIVLLLYTASFIFILLNGKPLPPPFEAGSEKQFILFRYSAHCVIASIFFELLYVSLISFILFRVFEKTQASDIIYFSVFLFACLIDSSRLLVVLFDISDTYSQLLLTCGNAALFSRILFPVALFFTVTMNSSEQRQNTEKYIFIMIICAIFISYYIPLNTASTKPNFCVEYSYSKIIKTFGTLCIVASCVILFVKNRIRFYNQKTTVGFVLLSTGIPILFSATTIFYLIISILFSSIGTYLFLTELHQQYLWND